MRRGRFLIGILLAFSAPGASAQSSIELAVTAADLSAPVPAAEASLVLGDERLLGDTGAVRWSVSAGGSALPGPGVLTGTMSARTELSRTVDQWVTVGWLALGGAADSSAGATLARAELGASIVANGDLASFTVSPWCAVQGFLDPLLEAGTALRLSLLAESVVMEPGLSARFSMSSSGEQVVALEPGIGLSWYPAFPLQATLGGRWAALLGAAGSFSAEWGGTVALSGAPLPGVLFSCTASVVQAAAGVSGEAEAELSVALWSQDRKWVSLPLRFAVAFSPGASPSASAALGVRFEW